MKLEGRLKMNNIFKYATKELSQDAFLCWSINWLNEAASHPLYQYGKAILDLFLADKNQEHYYEVEVRSQYEKIDVLVLFKDVEGNPHALIIEDKTNTSEHSNQMLRYKEKLLEKTATDTSLQKYKNPKVHLVYIKTGIMYDEDIRMVGKGATVVDLDDLLRVVSRFSKLNVSEILSSFNDHIQGIKNRRLAVEAQIENGQYEAALQDCYGQFYFLNKIFSERSKGTKIGNQYIDANPNPPVFIDNIYSGTNNGGTPWTQYCFWGDKYPRNFINENENEYHYLFWRIDCKWRQYETNKWKPYFYIALRHYDTHAHSGIEYLDERKRFVYRKFRNHADIEYAKWPHIFSKVGVRENYKESDLLFIPIEKIEHMRFDEIKELIAEITASFNEQYDSLYSGLEEALAAK